MKTDVQGSSTCEPGQERHESFKHGGINKVQYDYRHADGELFSGVFINLAVARQKRDEWMNKKATQFRVDKVSAFLESINAKCIRTTEWKNHNGVTEIDFMGANGYTFMVMKMYENGGLSLIEMFIQAGGDNTFDSMFDAVREYVNKKIN